MRLRLVLWLMANAWLVRRTARFLFCQGLFPCANARWTDGSDILSQLRDIEIIVGARLEALGDVDNDEVTSLISIRDILYATEVRRDFVLSVYH